LISRFKIPEAKNTKSTILNLAKKDKKSYNESEDEMAEKDVAEKHLLR